MSGKILRDYVSDIDKLLVDFDKNHPQLSASQKKEIAKHDRIQLLRDTENRLDQKSTDFESLL